MTLVTIALTRFDEPNWLLWQALDSLAAQRGVEGEVLVLDQTDDDATAKRCESLNRRWLHFRWTRIPIRSLSFARNQAIALAQSSVVLFIDSDAVADPDWARELAVTISRPGVGVAGGRVLPKWHRRPLLLAKARLVREQYSVLELGPGEAEVPKVVGAGFGIHRDRLGEQAYFDERLGRRAGILLSGEETDLCARTMRAGLGVRYNGRAVVHHHVLPERIRYRWVLKRIFYAGVSRALRGGSPSPTHRLRLWDLIFIPLIFPAYALGFVRGRGLKAGNGQPPVA